MSYLGKLSPTVGNGLGGMPERQTSVAIATTATYTDYIVTYCTQAPYIMMHKRVGDTLVQIANFGITLTSAPKDVRFSPLGTYLAICTGSVVNIYKHNKGFFSLLTSLTGWMYSTNNSNFSKDEKFFVVGTNESSTTNNIKAYTVSNDVFTPVANLTNQVSGVIANVAISANGTYIAVTSDNNANGTYGLTIYKWNGTSYSYLAKPYSSAGSSKTATPVFSSEEDQIMFIPDTGSLIAYSIVNDVFATPNPANSIIGSGASNNIPIVKGLWGAIGGGLAIKVSLFNFVKIYNTSTPNPLEVNDFGTYCFSYSGTNPYYLTMQKVSGLRSYSVVSTATSGFTNGVPFPTVATIKD